MSISLPELKVGERIEASLLVWDVDHRSGGNPHTILTLGNSSGKIQSAPFWHSELDRIGGLGRGDVVRVAGEIDQYRDRRQIRVAAIQRLARHCVNWRELLPHVRDVGIYWNRVDAWRANLAAPRLARIVSLFYDDHEFRRKYEECPASLSGHHSRLGGLLQHTAEVAAIGAAIARECQADADLVLAGALLHDIGKLDSYRWDGWFDLTERGALLGHVVLGSLSLAERVRTEPRPSCTEREHTLLQHLILSHHGKLEFGAPVLPMTLEAEILHYADDGSAKAATMAEAMRDSGHYEGEGLVSARAIWQLDRRRAYRGASDWGRPSAGIT